MSDIVEYASRYGLVVRGGFAVTQDDNVSPISAQQATRFLVLLGNAGSSIWQCFSQSEEYQQQLPHPLDKWSKRIGEQMAQTFNGRALFPFDKDPYYPFLNWATKAEGIQPSKLGLSIHLSYGLWHAYRFAIALPEVPVIEDYYQTTRDICLNCDDKPCLQACPVNAFDGNRYDTDACVKYLSSKEGNNCMRQGCAARGACPVGADYRYEDEHIQFHMDAFLLSRGKMP